MSYLLDVRSWEFWVAVGILLFLVLLMFLFIIWLGAPLVYTDAPFH